MQSPKMYHQATLTGGTIKKEPFIKKPRTLYHEFVNANFLKWAQDRKSFPDHVNNLWRDWRSRPETEIRALISELEASDRAACEGKLINFVTVKEKESGNTTAQDKENFLSLPK